MDPLVRTRTAKDHPEKTRAEKSGTLTDQAYAALRQQIFTGEIAPGADISEPELAERLAMSRTPVREALARLGTEGFVDAIPRRGYRVTPLTLADMTDLFALRSLLEGAAGALACQYLSPEEFDSLDAMAEASYEPAKSRSIASFITANERFHAAIARASRGRRLSALITSLLEECARYFYLGALASDISGRTNHEHHEIVSVLRRRDPDAARAIMITHNDQTRRGLLQAIMENPPGKILF